MNDDLTESEIALARRLGLSEAAVSIARRSGMSLPEMAASLRSLRETGELPNRGLALASRVGMKGNQVIREELDRQAKALRNTGEEVPDLADRAMTAISAWKANPKAKDAWKALAEAGAYMSIMLDFVAPAWADREGATQHVPAIS